MAPHASGWSLCQVRLYRCPYRYQSALANCPSNPPVVSIATSRSDAMRVETKDWWYSSLTAQTRMPSTERTDHFQVHLFFEPERNARRRSRPRIKYSNTWAAFLTIACIVSIRSMLKSGKRAWSIAASTGKVLSLEKRAVDMKKTNQSHPIKGSHRVILALEVCAIIVISKI